MYPVRKLPLLVASCALALGFGATTASALTVNGRGFGHGIGMSQYGAYGQAKAGIGWQDILKRYYTGTGLVTVAPSPTVRVLLQTGRTVKFTSAVDVGGQVLDPATTYTASIAGGQVRIRDAAGKEVTTLASPASVSGLNGQFQLKGKGIQGLMNGAYRGQLQLRINGSSLYAINAVALESYVRGVVSAESPSTWPADALRAQAVAARSYAITTTAGKSLGFDQWPDTRSQMYRGVAAEKPSTDAAVADTSGRVVAQNGVPVTTYFFSTSGGYTENVENTFLNSKPLNWLRGVADPYDAASPRHKWKLTFTKKALTADLRSYLNGGRFKRIKVLQRGVSPRIVRAEVIGTRGRVPVTGPQLRTALGLFDTWANFGGKDLKPKGGDSKTVVAPAPAAPSSTGVSIGGGSAQPTGPTGGVQP